MERTKYLLITLLCSLTLLVWGQSGSSIYRAYATGDMARWKRVMDNLSKEGQQDKEKQLEIINYQYGYIAWCLGQDNDQEAKRYLSRARKNISKLEKQGYRLSQLYAYKAAFIGFEIGLSPYKAPFIGSKSLAFAQQALELDAQNAMAHVQLGNIYSHMPAMMGGSRMKAIQHYQKAIELMEKREQATENWNYLNLLVATIETYTALKEYKNAEAYCLKALTVEPDFKWVKSKLYPEIVKKLSHE
ncbi:MAG: hypothetical protein CSA95_07735 [Bacteroidetes bacterium]|nr:MAG: hypothetical protein CSA95_07735 [Bacteroidota bacterium]